MNKPIDFSHDGLSQIYLECITTMYTHITSLPDTHDALLLETNTFHQQLTTDTNCRTLNNLW